MDRNKMRRQAQTLRAKRRVRATRRQTTQVKSGVIKLDSPLPKKATPAKPIATTSQTNSMRLEQKKVAKSQATRRQIIAKHKQRKRSCGGCNRKIGNS